MQVNEKVKGINQLATELTSVKNGLSEPTVVQCHGVFDLLHIGHIRHLEEAKRAGDILVVTVTPDQYVNKGPHRPAFTETLRAEAVAALDCVDYVAVNEWPTAIESIKLLKPNVYCKGSEYAEPSNDMTGKISDEVEAVESGGGVVLYTNDIVFSSSNLINRHLGVFSEEITDFLADFSNRFSSNDVFDYLDQARSMRVMVVGEIIIDEYQYCEQIGKSTKEPLLATRYMSTDRFAGGIAAVANHVSNFCDNVCMVTTLGEFDTDEGFVQDSLNSNIKTKFLYKKDSPTIVKRRFVENYLLQKLFEVYEINDNELEAQQEEELCAWLEKEVPQYDLVIVVDYGHGMMTKKIIDTVCRNSRFLTVNTQSNAANRGFNTISRYPRADYVSLALHEIALEERNRQANPQDMILSLSAKLACEQINVTRSKDGNICYSKKEGFTEVPAFTSHVVDRMGAGDAVLSITSLCAVQGAPIEMLGFLGNIVGAEAVGTLGHSASIQKLGLYRHIESLMK